MKPLACGHQKTGKFFPVAAPAINSTVELHHLPNPFYKTLMRISSFSPFTAPPAPVGPARVNAAGVPDTFAPPQAPPSTAGSMAAGSASAARGPISVDMLMSIAGSEGDREQRKRVAENAEQGLDRLEALHTEALNGKVNPDTLNGLTQWLSDQSDQIDPQVASIMKDISLRAKVELAKREMAAASANG